MLQFLDNICSRIESDKNVAGVKKRFCYFFSNVLQSH